MKLIVTKDGSNSIELADAAITYHSRHGAIAESTHVYMNTGLSYFFEKFAPTAIRIFEMGFGTGLNALLTYQFAKEHGIQVEYTSIDLHPVATEIYTSLNFASLDNLDGYSKILQLLHESPWNQRVKIDEQFSLEKIHADIASFIPCSKFDLIYYDAFSPADMPEHWTEAIFSRMFDSLNTGGVLVTYSSKSSVRRALRAAGFLVKKLPGPYGKREIVRASKA